MPLPSTPAVVQQNTIAVGGTTQTNINAVFSAGTAALSKIILVIVTETNAATVIPTAASFTATGGATFALAYRFQVTTLGCIEVWHTIVPPAAGSTTVQANLSGSLLVGWTMMEVSGLSPYCTPIVGGLDTGIDFAVNNTATGTSLNVATTPFPATLGEFLLIPTFSSSAQTSGWGGYWTVLTGPASHTGAQQRYAIGYSVSWNHGAVAVNPIASQTTSGVWATGWIAFVGAQPPGFEVLNDPSAALNSGIFAPQSRLDKVEIDSIIMGSQAQGVLTGLLVGQASNTQVGVSAGAAQSAGFYPFPVAAVATIAVPASNPSNPRRDLVVAAPPSTAGGAGLVQYITGVAGAIPAVPQVPNGCVPLAIVDVPANATILADYTHNLSSTFSHIIDKRVFVQPVTLGPPAVYNPTTVVSYSMTSTTPANVDATNLKVTFVAPATGNVRVELQGYGFSTTVECWCLMSSPSVVVASTPTLAIQSATGTAQNTHMSIYVTGLTPGAQYTWYWGWFIRSGGSGSVSMFVGGNPTLTGSQGQASMAVFAV